jgi:hypothetical protein
VRRLLLTLLLLGGCGPDDETDVDPLCVDAPVLTWDNFGRGFLTQNCQSCHASTSLDRQDAPVDITFDTEADVAVHQFLILLAATGDAPIMPPEGGVDALDREKLEIWLTCFPP